MEYVIDQSGTCVVYFGLGLQTSRILEYSCLFVKILSEFEPSSSSTMHMLERERERGDWIQKEKPSYLPLSTSIESSRRTHWIQKERFCTSEECKIWKADWYFRNLRSIFEPLKLACDTLMRKLSKTQLPSQLECWFDYILQFGTNFWGEKEPAS